MVSPPSQPSKVILTSLLLGVMTALSHAFVESPLSGHPRCCRLWSTSTPNLEGMTVPELKVLLTESGLKERGLLTKLKRKQDLVDYLQDKLIHHPMPAQKSEDNILNEEPKSNEENTPAHVSDSSESILPLVSAEIEAFHPLLREKLARRDITELLPIQSKAFRHVQSGRDAVIHSPTGSGKTLAFVLPLAARMYTKDDVLQPHAKGKHSSKRNVAVSPAVLTVVPSRELANQVGKEWAKYSAGPVATVFGGVPIERHTSLIRKGGGAHVIVGTPGRLRELVREGHLDFKQVRTVVLDEADTILDASDSPEVQAILRNIDQAVGERQNPNDQQYQLVLVSATVNKLVRDFAMETMEISLKSKSFISVKGDESRPPAETLASNSLAAVSPDVLHWCTATKVAARPFVTVDLISTLSPRMSIIFVQTKAETESVASYLSSKLHRTNIRALHGDMTQSARSRTMALIRDSLKNNPDARQVLVATDVASRGLDLPHVDLVVQFGIPRLAGKEGTCSAELYTHRTGRAGRMQTVRRGDGQHGMSRTANAVMLYDPSVGEGKVLSDLQFFVKDRLNVSLEKRPIPSTTEIIDSAYDRLTSSFLDTNDDDNAASVKSNAELISYFRSKLEADDRLDTLDPETLLQSLSTALAAFSNLSSLSPHDPRCSLLTGDATTRTLCVSRTTEEGQPVPLNPAQVTQFCKQYGSGKLSRCYVTNDQAFLDLATKRAKKLLHTIQSTDDETLDGWKLELANSSHNLSDLQ